MLSHKQKFRQQIDSTSTPSSKGVSKVENVNETSEQENHGVPSFDQELGKQTENQSQTGNAVEESYKDSSNRDQQEPDVEEEEERTRSLSEVFAGAGSPVVGISPRIHVNISARKIEDYPSSAKIGDTVFDLHSPLRKGKSGNHGIARDRLSNLVNFISEAASDDTAILSSSEGQVAEAADRLIEYFTDRVRSIMYEGFGDDLTFKAKRRIDVLDEEQSEDSDDKSMEMGESHLETVRYSITDLIDVNSWNSAYVDRKSSKMFIRPTVAINICMPFMADGNRSTTEIVNVVHKIFRNYSIKLTNDVGNGVFSYALNFNSSELLDPNSDVLELIENSVNDAEEAKNTVISTAYVKRSINNPESDFLGLLPFDTEEQRIDEALFPNGDLLIVY